MEFLKQTRQLHKLIHNIWQNETIPQDWKDCNIVTIYKKKGNKSTCGNNHGISLLFVAGKVLHSDGADEELDIGCNSLSLTCNIHGWVHSGFRNLPSFDPAMCTVRERVAYKENSSWQELAVDKSLVMCGDYCLVVPLSVCHRVVQLGHDGHQGLVHTKQRLQRSHRRRWPLM